MLCGVRRLLWVCTCDCGKVVEHRGYALRGGSSGVKSCGCLHHEGPTNRAVTLHLGRKYRHATINKYLGDQVYEFTCTCGTLFLRHSKHIHARVNCGCINNRQKSVAEVGCNTVYGVYQDNAARKGLPFELPKVTFTKLLQDTCAYCNEPPSNQLVLSGNRVFKYNGIDRLDNTKGYLQGNVVTCCKRCNYLKNKYSYVEFTGIVKRIYENLKLQGKL